MEAEESWQHILNVLRENSGIYLQPKFFSGNEVKIKAF